MHEGKEVLGIRLTWEKRYITLGPVATLLGLAFKLFDPDKLLGGKEDIGITLALIPTSHKGVNIGRRHIPLGCAFMNGPNSGKDVFIPMDWVIGGKAQVGQGWRMLMECLAAGRSISLPSMSMAAGKLGVARHRRLRARALAVQDADRQVRGHRGGARAHRRQHLHDGRHAPHDDGGARHRARSPAVISAICKYHMTERMRSIINDAMDVHGGKGICMGPNNYLGHAYHDGARSRSRSRAPTSSRARSSSSARARSAAIRAC